MWAGRSWQCHWAELQHSLLSLPSRAGTWGTPWAQQHQQQLLPAPLSSWAVTGHIPGLVISWRDARGSV